MSITEGQRHELHQGLVEAVGRERAETLMSMLPPTGWADVATNQDLDHLGTVMSLRMEAMESRLHAGIAGLRTEMHIGLRNQLLGIFGSVMAAALVNQVLARVL